MFRKYDLYCLMIVAVFFMLFKLIFTIIAVQAPFAKCPLHFVFGI